MFARLKQILWGALFGTLIATQALGQATLLPNAKQQFFTPQGIPAAAGTVDMFAPGGNTRKTTWKSSTESTGNQNTNPINLDAGGFATIYGDGSYRQVVKDADGNTIWDAITASTGSGGGGGGGTATGDGDLVGTVKPWAGFQAPNQYIFAYGQAISRTTYSVLFAAITYPTSVICTSGLNVLSGISNTASIPLGSTVEASCVAPGTTVTAKATNSVTVSANASVSTAITARFFFYGAGDNSTTFNVPDLRGRVTAGLDCMGGTCANRLNTIAAASGLGTVGGAQNQTLVPGSIPSALTFSTVITDPQHLHAIPGLGTVSVQNGSGASQGNLLTSSGGTPFAENTSLASTGISAATTLTNGGNTPVGTIQPTMELNYIIKVTPDANSLTASGVTDIQGMTGSIACASTISCTGNIIGLGVGSPTLAGTNFWTGSNYFGGLNPWCDVKGQGAVGDGSTDDLPAFNRCLNIIKALGSVWSGTIYLPVSQNPYCIKSGTWTIDGAGGSGIRIVGGGVGNSVISTCGTNPAGGLINLNTVYSTIENLSIAAYGAYIGDDDPFTTPPGPALTFGAACVTCKTNHVVITGGSHAIKVTTNDVYITDIVAAYQYGEGAGATSRSSIIYGTNSGFWITRAKLDQVWPVVLPPRGVPINPWINGHAYATGDVAIITQNGVSYYVQAFAGGTTAALQPKLKIYNTAITDGTVGWLLVAPTTYYALQLDTGAFETTGDQIDMSGSFTYGLAMTNTLGGTAPQIIKMYASTIGQTLSGNILASAGNDLNTWGIEAGYCVLAGCAGINFTSGFVGPASILGLIQYGGSDYGVVISGGRDILVTGARIYATTVNAAKVSAGVTQFNLSNNNFPLSNSPVGFGGNNTAGITIDAGASDYYEITGSICHGTPCVVDGGTGVNKKVELAEGPWSIANGGTGANVKATAFNNLSPMTTAGDLIYGGASGTGTRLAAGTSSQVLLGGTTPSWVSSTITINSTACTLGSSCTIGSGPVGAAGGDLTGTYPNPTLAAIITAGGPTGSATVAPIITYDAKGRLTAVSSATVTPAIGSITGLGAGVGTWLATPSSANLVAAVTDETGSGALVFANSPALVTPNLGTPTAAILTNATGTASGLTAGNVTTNANLTGAVTSVGNATSLGSFTSANLAGALTDETGNGSAVFQNLPTLISPTLSGTVAGANTIPLSILAQSAANTMLGNWTGSTANVVANAMPSCSDSGGNHLNYVSGTGITCGTSVGAAAAGTLTGATLAAGVTASSLTSLGTITSLTATTINAFTQGGNISGGGFQHNNVVIGASTPLAGSFTTVSGSTSVTSPVHIGGSAAGSTVELRTTSGTGSGDAALVTGGTNGATRIATFLGSGLTGFGSAAGAAVPTNTVVEISSNATTVDANAGFSTLLHATGANTTNPSIVMDSFAGIPVMAFRSAGGTAASKTALGNAITFMAFGGYGWNGSAYVQGAAINASTSQAWTGSVNGSFLRFYTVATGATASVENMRLWGSGGLSVGTGAIGTDPGTDSLQVNGQAFIPNATSDAGLTDSTACIRTSNGQILKGSGTLGICLGTSSARFKQDIVSMGAGLAEIVQLTPKNFFYKKGFGDDGKRQQYGLIAEEVVKVLPGITTPDKDGKPQAVDLLALVPVLVHAVQELKGDNDNLRKSIRALELAGKK